MGFRTASASDYAELLKETSKNASGVSKWEEYFLQPLQESFETAGKQISAKTSYDISSAYANYKKSQLSLLQNQALATGFKEQASEDLKSQYESAFATSKAEEASNLQTLSQQYQKQLQTEETRLLEEGANLANLEKAIFDFRGVDTDDLETLGYYETVDGETRLTDKGKAFIDETLNAPILIGEGKKATMSRFSDYLYDTDSDLYDYYIKNLGSVRETIGGLAPTDVSYDLSDYNNLFKDMNTAEIKTSEEFVTRVNAAETKIKDSMKHFLRVNRYDDVTNEDVDALTLDELINISMGSEMGIGYSGNSKGERLKAYEDIVKILETTDSKTADRKSGDFRHKIAVAIRKKKGK